MRLILFTISLLYAQLCNAQYQELSKLLPVSPSNHLSEFYAGDAVAIEDSIAVVGAPYGGTLGTNSPFVEAGFAYLLMLNEEGWVISDTLFASDGKIGDQFGTEVAISGSTVVVGAPEKDDSEGGVYVFETSGGKAEEVAIIPIPLSSQEGKFGKSVGIHNNIIVVGAPDDDYEAQRDGSVFVFEFDGVNVEYKAKLNGTSQTSLSWFGYSVGIDGNTIVVGASGEVGSRGSAYIFHYENGQSSLISRFIPSDGAGGDEFGRDVAIENSSIVVGSPRKEGGGAAYLFELIDNTVVETGKLVPENPAPLGFFGTTVDISSNTAIVGALNSSNGYGAAYLYDVSSGATTPKEIVYAYDNNGWIYGHGYGSSVALDNGNFIVGSYLESNEKGIYAGSTYQYSWNGDSSTFVTKTYPPGFEKIDFQLMGTSVDVDGDLAVVGAPGAMEGRGMIYVFEYENGLWTFKDTITDTRGSGSQFGKSVAVSNNVIVAGVENFSTSDKPNQGDVLVYEFRNGEADLKVVLRPLYPSANRFFGNAVDIDGPRIIVGARLDDGMGNNSGAAYLFSYDLATGGSAELEEIFPTDAGAFRYFGTSVAIKGNDFVVGATGELGNTGAAYLFSFESGVGLTELGKIKASDGSLGDWFGIDVAMTEDHIAIGAAFDSNESGEDAGAAYLYSYAGANISNERKVLANDGASNNEFGTRVSLVNDRLLVGAPFNVLEASPKGSAYVYDISSNPPELISKLTSSDGHMNDQFGLDVALSNSGVFVGATENDEKGENAGAVYYFENCEPPLNQTITSITSELCEGEVISISLEGSEINVQYSLYNPMGQRVSAFFVGDVGPVDFDSEDTLTISGNYYVVANAQGLESCALSLDVPHFVSISLKDRVTDNVVACDSYTWIDGITYNSSNSIAQMVFTNSFGCDSIVTLNLELNYSTFGTDEISACDSYTWIDGITYSSSTNTPEYIIPNAQGCDSLVQLELSIINSTSSTETVTTCDHFSWIDGNIYTESNQTAQYTLTNSMGCDSIVTLDLTVLKTTYFTDEIASCEPITWIDGNTYSTNNSTAQYILTNSAGCDSIVSLNYSLLVTSAIDKIYTCDSIVWIDGNTYTTNNTTAQHILVNNAGCDSVVTLDLSITTFIPQTDKIEACELYTWRDGITYTESNSTAKDTLFSASGCDTIISLDLSIFYPSSVKDNLVACDSLEWIDGNIYTTSNSSAQYTLVGSGGCDSVVTLDLTIHQSNFGTEEVTACYSFTWIDGNTYESDNNTAQVILTNSVGCDSLVTLDLTIEEVHNAGIISFGDSIQATHQDIVFCNWLDCATMELVPGANGTVFYPETTGDYAALVLGQNGCVDTTECVSFVASVNEITAGVVDVFPNPNNGSFWISSPHGPLGEITIQNALGQKMESLTPNKQSILVEGLELGVYFVSLAVNGNRIVKKVVVE